MRALLNEIADRAFYSRLALNAIVSIKPLFAWYDLWVGAFWDGKSRRLYILPIPCCGIVIQFRRKSHK